MQGHQVSLPQPIESMTTGFPRHLLLAALTVPVLASCRRATPSAPPDLPVTVAAVERRDVPIVIEATGSAEPLQAAAVEAQVGGILDSVAFAEGGEVREGQVLFKLDPRPYRAMLAEAEGVLARDAAQYDAAKRDLDRTEELAAQQFVTIQERDQAREGSARWPPPWSPTPPRWSRPAWISRTQPSGPRSRGEPGGCS